MRSPEEIYWGYVNWVLKNRGSADEQASLRKGHPKPESHAKQYRRNPAEQQSAKGQMNLLVTRTTFTPFSVSGTLLIDGQTFYTLEPPKRDEKPRAIPCGTYDVSIRWSEKHKRLVPHVENVPGFEEIEIHIGNFPKDTLGCLLVGKAASTDQIVGSRLAFDVIFRILSDVKESGEAITITYKEAEGANA